MKWSLSLLLLVSAFSVSVSCTHGCTRSCVAPFVPKLDLKWQLHRTRDVAGVGGAALGEALPGQHAGQHVHMGVSAWLRWQPTVYAAFVPERFDLAPSAWLAPCDADDSACFDDFARDEPEIAESLRAAP